MVEFTINGVLAPVFTPIDSKGNVNLDIIPEYMKYLAEKRVNGILVGGTTGEAVTLSLEERKAVLEAWLREAKPHGVAVIAQIGGVPLPDVIKMAEYSELLKADAIMTLPELYFKPKSVQQLVSYLEQVSQAAPSLPLLYYHFPMMSGVDLNMPEFFSAASSRVKNFKGMKADLGVAVQVADLLDEDQKIFIANHLLAPSALMGHDSSIATVTNMFPDLVHNILDSMKCGEIAKARAFQEKLNRLVAAIASQGEFVPAMKVAMKLVTGVDVGPPRRPQAQLDKQRASNIEKSLSTLGVETKKSIVDF